jgi:hypothetical protein
MRSHLGTLNVLLETGVKVIFDTLLQKLNDLCSFPRALQKGEYESDDLEYLTKEIPNRNTEGPAWALLTGHRHIQGQ